MPGEIRAFVFDAVGTLIHAMPAVSTVYAAVGRKRGIRLAEAVISQRFRDAFRRQDEIDRRDDWVTDEARELRRWHEIVAETLPDADQESCFAELYDHFAQPTAWNVDPAANEVIAAIRRRNLVVAMASNFDRRLHGIVAGHPELEKLNHVIVSSEVGVRKPARGFFEAIERCLEISAKRIAFVGDDPVNDGQGAADAGMRSILLGRDVKSLGEIQRFLH